jgi:hypothetical protein
MKIQKLLAAGSEASPSSFGTGPDNSAVLAFHSPRSASLLPSAVIHPQSEEAAKRASNFPQRDFRGVWLILAEQVAAVSESYVQLRQFRVLELGLLSYGDFWYNRWRLFLEGGKLHANVAERAGAAAAARMHPSLRPSCNTKRFSLVFVFEQTPS